MAGSCTASSFKVSWEDEKGLTKHAWIFPDEMIVNNDWTKHVQLVKPTLEWTDIKGMVKDFANHVQDQWKNTRGLRQQLQEQNAKDEV